MRQEEPNGKGSGEGHNGILNGDDLSYASTITGVHFGRFCRISGAGLKEDGLETVVGSRLGQCSGIGRGGGSSSDAATGGLTSVGNGDLFNGLKGHNHLPKGIGLQLEKTNKF